MPYPVTVVVTPQLANRDRLTTAFRLILGLPHIVLVGALSWNDHFGGAGLLGAAAFVMAVISWFTIVLSGQHLPGIRQFTRYYLGWRTRAIAYLTLLEDSYPPFGEGSYPASIEVIDPTEPRDRVTVGLRLLLLIPQLIVFFFVGVAWLVTTIIAWFAILLTGQYPESLYGFGVGAMRWLLRLEAYGLLMVDEYPPFSLE